MSGVTPDSTTAALAAAVPKEDANGSLPGTFPETPGQESDNMLSVNPIPASGGIGNPVKLNPGETVPDPGSIHDNTIQSTVKLDKESYEKGSSVPLAGAGSQNPTTDTAGSSAFAVPPVSKNTIPESSLPMGGPAQRAAATDSIDPGYTIQSAAPTSTTAALAANVPLEKTTNGDSAPAREVPQIVKDSLAEAHQDPEAATNRLAVEEKKDVEQELHEKVKVEESAGTPAPTVSASTQPTAPGLAAVAAQGIDSADVSPNTTPPPGRATTAAAPTSAPAADPKAAVSGVGKEQIQSASGPTVTTGVASAPTTETTTPKKTEAAAQQSATTQDTAAVSADAKDEKKKKRMSGFFSKIKEKLK